jgi:nicotinate dehydrogenase subunit A
MPSSVALNVNGRDVSVIVDDPGVPLLYVLRNELGLRGPRFGCGLGQCGACMVLIDGEEAKQLTHVRQSCRRWRSAGS